MNYDVHLEIPVCNTYLHWHLIDKGLRPMIRRPHQALNLALHGHNQLYSNVDSIQTHFCQYTRQNCQNHLNHLNCPLFRCSQVLYIISQDYSIFYNIMIIHISGPSGSGKTTLGNALQKEFGKRIVVKDIDDLRRDFIKAYYGNKKFDIIDKEEYQKYIDGFVKKHSSKPLIFVGLNHMPWWHPNHYYDMHSTHNYFIDMDDETIIKQKCRRLLLEWANSEEDMKYLVDNNEKYIKNVSGAIAEECSLKKTVKLNKKWRKDYMKRDYKFMSREAIFKNVSKILRSQQLV